MTIAFTNTVMTLVRKTCALISVKVCSPLNNTITKKDVFLSRHKRYKEKFWVPMRNWTSDVRICAPMLYHWATKTLQWARSITSTNTLCHENKSQNLALLLCTLKWLIGVMTIYRSQPLQKRNILSKFSPFAEPPPSNITFVP